MIEIIFEFIFSTLVRGFVYLVLELAIYSTGYGVAKLFTFGKLSLNYNPSEYLKSENIILVLIGILTWAAMIIMALNIF